MAKKIYVGNLNYTASEDQLSEHFGQFGAVISSVIITDRYSGQSKGFGFVEMEEDEAAEAAISALDGTDFMGRNLRVAEARERQPR